MPGRRIRLQDGIGAIGFPNNSKSTAKAFAFELPSVIPPLMSVSLVTFSNTRISIKLALNILYSSQSGRPVKMHRIYMIRNHLSFRLYDEIQW